MSHIDIKRSHFCRVYTRQSKTPYQDKSTLLILADVISATDTEILLGFERYTYIHRDIAGAICGLSISKQMLVENSEFDGRYLSGVDMYRYLVNNIEEITTFCELFNDEFVSMFLVPPRDFFYMAESAWRRIIEVDK